MNRFQGTQHGRLLHALSEAIENVTPEEQVWLGEQLEVVQIAKDAANRPASLADYEDDYEGPRFLLDYPDLDPDDTYRGFDVTMYDDWVWIGAEENGNPGHAAWLMHKFLKKFRPDQYWSLTYANTCSKPRVGAYSGGAFFVTADSIKQSDACDFLSLQATKFSAKQQDV